jgi:hypothetical protein
VGRDEIDAIKAIAARDSSGDKRIKKSSAKGEYL